MNTLTPPFAGRHVEKARLRALEGSDESSGGHRLRVDTTVVETHIHYPRDNRTAQGVALENLALRQQVALWKARQPRPRLTEIDRIFWAPDRLKTRRARATGGPGCESAALATRH